MIASFSYGLHNAVRRAEVHIGYPHRQQVFSAEDILYHIVFHAAGAASGDDFVKIVLCHDDVKLRRQRYKLIENFNGNYIFVDLLITEHHGAAVP